MLRVWIEEGKVGLWRLGEVRSTIGGRDQKMKEDEQLTIWVCGGWARRDRRWPSWVIEGRVEKKWREKAWDELKKREREREREKGN